MTSYQDPVVQRVLLSGPPERSGAPMYSRIVWEHSQRPQNRGQIENPDAVGESFYPPCGDR
ncbi:MAG: hypothetical protein KC910_34520, partial [Candidatus Eremiobacteraeota bacterium]|nr:hypothetical protein [Candidatus Eremiobacteraeota bacterium]